MPHLREPILHPVPIADLRPTQITVGMREVKQKRAAWRRQKAEHQGEFLGQHMVPVILGPKARHYIIDHHHLARALHDEGVTEVLVTIVADLKRLSSESFWFVLDNRGWTHPFDETGKRRDYADIPKTVADLREDPFRSLAGELRFAGGYAKDIIPFSEFLWADFLRQRIKRKDAEMDFDAAVTAAMQLAKSTDADYLPGWCGPVTR